MPAVSWANFNPEGRGGIILRAIYPQPRRLTREQAVAMPLEDLRGLKIRFFKSLQGREDLAAFTTLTRQTASPISASYHADIDFSREKIGDHPLPIDLRLANAC